MSLQLSRSEPLFRTIRELPGIGKRHRTTDDIRLHRNLPLSFMVVRQKPTQTFLFKVFLALNLDFHLKISYFREKSSRTITCPKLINIQQ